ncbi:MAG: hypothetical protein ACRDKZ_15340 [Actinomycetota bacterium]
MPALVIGFLAVGFVADVPTVAPLCLFPPPPPLGAAERAWAEVGVRPCERAAVFRVVFLEVVFFAVVFFAVFRAVFFLRAVNLPAVLRALVFFFAEPLRALVFLAALRALVFFAVAFDEADLRAVVFFVGFLRVEPRLAEVLRADAFFLAAEVLDLRDAVFLAGLMGAGR